jgi:hypothetical protein
VVMLQLALCVLSRLVRPRERATRLRSDPDPIVGVWLLEFGFVHGSIALRLRIMCHMIGRLLQSIPPRGSKTEYIPRGT